MSILFTSNNNADLPSIKFSLAAVLSTRGLAFEFPLSVIGYFIGKKGQEGVIGDVKYPRGDIVSARGRRHYFPLVNVQFPVVRRRA